MRYILFAGDGFYPEGGWHDFIAVSDSLEALEKLITSKDDPANKNEKYITGLSDWVYEKDGTKWHCDWWHIVDVEKRDIIRYQR